MKFLAGFLRSSNGLLHAVRLSSVNMSTNKGQDGNFTHVGVVGDAHGSESIVLSNRSGKVTVVPDSDKCDFSGVNFLRTTEVPYLGDSVKGERRHHQHVVVYLFVTGKSAGS